jgi:hypothetical protein
MSKAINWYINELILRGSGNFGGVLQNYAGPLSRNIDIFLTPQLEPVQLAP